VLRPYRGAVRRGHASDWRPRRRAAAGVR
jgi:hypothetical protein